ncbi:hypothetical protein BU16DRAFT_458437 [Lophium mytilinum]|uniref:Uncharacterized protein n=1 Tax=Lophium mytilinum TaxID=390894 RepID=A0A6A6QZQ5_9PEZI|nr:hypothetical protein BU16DRAFT_458437 [Lophium mytilinum]
MFASLLRPQQARRASSERSPLIQAFRRAAPRQNADSAVEETEDEDDEFPQDEDVYEEDAENEDDEEDDDGDRDGPLLPVFSEMLDRLPIYSTTHSIRIIVIQRCETTLSWDQLRSPQVSQFLVKPIQQQIRSSHFSRATLYALIANCLQFQKEGQLNPGVVGVSKTRAMICELLAMRLIKEFSTRELIDALSYDFDPLQGMLPLDQAQGANRPRSSPRAARISTIEIAIRAQSKKFLAHPLVVQQLEAIWAGTIVFHSAADNLHRTPSRRDSPKLRAYGTMREGLSPGRGPSNGPQVKMESSHHLLSEATLRRSVTLYDPHDASLFKLSRLRVPRYRQLFSTGSFAVMLGLFLAVLVQKSDDITGLEVVFWFWSAGFMLDEIVGFTEQGFGLYIMSVWNAFDLGILFLFVAYYVLRLYGILMPSVQKHYVANMAYDVLGTTAVLLFPRLFSVLDHYRYFSQLLIAFRMMAMDLVAILVLIIIACSGFFVAFTLAFSNDLDAGGAAYALFQMLMGFTPAAWDIWGEYNILGKGILTLFLFICHFLIVTILITVLTNSFMAIVQNANEEHQFLFAVNTISMVKSDALFSYIAPTNVLGWLLIPLRFFMPFRKFIKMNRTVIKMTHLPVLFAIFAYERFILSYLAYGPTDLVEQRGRSAAKLPAFTLRGPGDLFSPGARLREPSITTFQKDRALDEVFRRPFRDPSLSQANAGTIVGRRKSSNVVRDWMQGIGHERGTPPPMEEPRSVLDQLESRRPRIRRAHTGQQPTPRRKNRSVTTRSVASDPEELLTMRRSRPYPIQEEEGELPDMSMDDILQTDGDADGDGDDELVTNDEDEQETSTRQNSDKENRPHRAYSSSSEEDYFRTPMTAKPETPVQASSLSSSAARARQLQPNAIPSYFFGPGASRPVRGHARQLSTNTVLFNPAESKPPSQPQSKPTSQPSRQPSGRQSRATSPAKRPTTATRSGTATPSGRRTPTGRRTPKRPVLPTIPSARARPIMPPHGLHNSALSFSDLLGLNIGPRRDPSFNARALDLASDLGDNKHGPDFGALPASFSTQLEMEAMRRSQKKAEEEGMVSRIMLARMTTLEEGFRDVLKEVKGLRGFEQGTATVVTSRTGSTKDGEGGAGRKRSGKGRRKGEGWQRGVVEQVGSLPTETLMAQGEGEGGMPDLTEARGQRVGGSSL